MNGLFGLIQFSNRYSTIIWPKDALRRRAKCMLADWGEKYALTLEKYVSEKERYFRYAIANPRSRLHAIRAERRGEFLSRWREYSSFRLLPRWRNPMADEEGVASSSIELGCTRGESPLPHALESRFLPDCEKPLNFPPARSWVP